MDLEIFRSHGFEDALIEEFKSTGHLVKAKPGDVLIDSALDASYIPFVLEGVLKVYRTEESGKEVLLYYLEKGETCAKSIACCMDDKVESVKVVADTDAKVWKVPNQLLDRWISNYPSFRRFTFSSYQQRFDELLTTIDSMAFTNMGERLFKYLLDAKQIKESYVIEKTHEVIARDLGTSRVVVSRLLKKLEQDGIIEQYRNRIEIL